MANVTSHILLVWYNLLMIVNRVISNNSIPRDKLSQQQNIMINVIKVKLTLQYCMESSSEAKSLRAKCQYLIKIWRWPTGAGWVGIHQAEISGALDKEGDRLAFRMLVLVSVNLIVNRDYLRTQQRKLMQWKGLEDLLQPYSCHFCLAAAAAAISSHIQCFCEFYF